MTMRKLLSGALAGLMLIFLVPAVRSADKPDDGLATHQHAPFLVNMKALLNSRAPSTGELEKLSAYIQQYPNDPDGHLVIANAYNKLGMDGMYAEELEKAWRLSPGSLLYLFSALKARAVTDDHPSFDHLVDEAFQSYKNDANTLSKMGQLFQDNNQNTLAIRFLTRAVELDPKTLQLLCSYCYSLLALRRYRELISATAPLFLNEKTRTVANLLRGLAWYNLNQSEKAEPLLAEAYREAPEQAEIAEAYFDILVATGKRCYAVQPALMALALQPPFGKHMIVLKAKVKPIIARARTSDLEDGIMLVNKTIPPNRSLALFYFALGDLLDKSDRVLNAAHCFSAGLFLDRSLGRAYMRLAHDMEILGAAPDKVMDLYEQAALMSRDDREVMAKYERMKARMPALDKDIAGKIKCAINNVRYKT